MRCCAKAHKKTALNRGGSCCVLSGGLARDVGRDQAGQLCTLVLGHDALGDECVHALDGQVGFALGNVRLDGLYRCLGVGLPLVCTLAF